MDNELIDWISIHLPVNIPRCNHAFFELLLPLTKFEVSSYTARYRYFAILRISMSVGSWNRVLSFSKIDWLHLGILTGFIDISHTWLILSKNPSSIRMKNSKTTVVVLSPKSKNCFCTTCDFIDWKTKT